LLGFHCPGVMKPGSSRLFQTLKAGPTQASNEHMLPAKKSVAVLYKFHLNISLIYTYTVVYKI